MSRQQSKAGAIQTHLKTNRVSPSQNNVYLRGTEQGSIQKPREKASRHSTHGEEIMLVPDSLCTINRIVGCRANKILQFEKQSGAKIEFAKVSDENGNYEFRIHGRATCVTKAKQMMTDLIEEISTNDSEERVEVSQKVVARLIGNRGSNIQKLQNETGATIDIDTDSIPPTVCIRGSDDSVVVATRKICDFVDMADDESKPVLTQELEVPKAVVKKLMGPHAEARKWLDEGTGMPAPGQFSRPSVSWTMSYRSFSVSLSLMKPVGDPATLCINGSVDSVLKAIEYIETLMDCREVQEAGAQDESDMMVDEQCSVSECTMEFPRDRAGDIIGSGGSRIHRLRIKSGAEIRIDKGGISCFVHISGDAKQVALAKKLVREVMAQPPVPTGQKIAGRDLQNRSEMRQASTSSRVGSKPRPSCAAHLL